MSNKTSSHPIPPLDFDADWGSNREDGKPQSGEQVNEFINDSFRDVARACWFDPSSYTLLFFRSDADKQTYISNPLGSDSLVVYRQVLSFTGTVRRVNITNVTGTTKINVTTNMENVPIEFAYELVEKGVTESEWRVLEDSATIIVYVDSGNGYSEVRRYQNVEHSDPAIVVNVRGYLNSGSNKVKVTAIANDDEHTTANLVYNITLAEMYVENFEGRSYWNRAVIEGMTQSLYQLGGFKIVGSLNKTLNFDIYDYNDRETRLLHLEKVLGNRQYIGYEYSYTYGEGLRLDSLETGTYVAKVYLTSGSLSTLENAIEYPFMYVEQGDKLTAQLVVMANIAPVVYNGEPNVMCEFAAYNAGLSSASPVRSVQQYKGSVPYMNPIEYDGAINTDTAYELECPVNIEDETTEIGYLRTEITVTLGGSSVVGGNNVDNSATYPPVSGYDFSMNPSIRSNGEAHPEYVNNDANGSVCESVTWSKMAFVDGVDGWTKDEDGRSCLRLQAGSKMVVPFSFFKFLNNSNQGRNTVEICYKVANVSDYSENVITIAQNPTQVGFTGLRIRPNNITAHSSTDTSESDDANRGTNIREGQIVDFMLSVEPLFASGKNLVTGFIDGCKNFQFEYTGNWNFNADLIIGSDTADVNIYALRHYANSLRQDSAEANYISTIKDRASKIAERDKLYSVIDGNHDITIDKVKANGYNYFVVEMKNGASIPSKKEGWDKSTLGQSTLEMHFGQHPSWDFRVEDVETGGQGTTSMNYWLWNLRFRLDKWVDGIPIPERYQDGDGKYNKKRAVSYLNENGEWGEPTDSKTLFFDGGNIATEKQHPAVKRITAKINFASSMQSHKMGATWAFDVLHSSLNGGSLKNEAQVAAESAGTPVPTVAVCQYPAFGFSKDGDSYIFIGLFTIGADKGDKPTFGYDNPNFEDELITLEGTDHTPRLALFNHPWDSDVAYRASNECLNIITGVAEQDVEGGWEVGNCGGLSTDKISDELAIQNLLEREFKPAYEVAYNNSTLIFPVALSDPNWGGANAQVVLANINADILSESGTFWTSHYGDSRFAHNEMEFWIEGEYVLYHYSPASRQYVAGVNLVTQCGTPTGDTLDAKNEYFKAFRRAAFKANAANYWDIDDSIFCLCFLLIFGATDNFAKNSYPYKFKSLENGGRWRWRQDDLDTIFDIDNNGGQTKPYWIEFADTDANGGVYFAGSASVFWNLLFEAFFDDYTAGAETKRGVFSVGGDILKEMQTLAGGGRVYDGCIAFLEEYFWNKAQNYFPVSAYNSDGAIKYEDAWVNQSNPTVQPLTQSLGSHYIAERRWVDFRLLYVMSLFRVGAFSQYTDTTFGAISFRPVSLPSLVVTVGAWMYPSVLIGQGESMETSRVSEGSSKTFTGFSGGGQTTYIIQASNFITDLGDLCKLILGSQDAGTLNIGARMLKRLKIGDADASEVAGNVTTINFIDTPSLEEIDARNSQLSNVLNVSNCPRIKKIYAEGTDVSSVRLKDGSKIELLHLPSSVTELILKKTKFLNDLTIDGNNWAGIVTLEMEECNAIGTIEALERCFNAVGSALEYIQLKWNTLDEIDSNTIKMLSYIAQGKDASGVSRVYDADLEGRMKLDSPYYESDLQGLQFQEVTPSSIEGYKEALTTIFSHPLRLFYKEGAAYQYVLFDDAEIKRVLLAASIGDGYGITAAQAAAITTQIPSFSGNTVIESFNELGTYFTGVTSIKDYQFQNCSNLDEIDLTNITSLGTAAFYNASLHNLDVNMPNITLLSDTGVGSEYTGKFQASGIRSFRADRCTRIGYNTSYPERGGGAFRDCVNLITASLPVCTELGNKSFAGCSSLVRVVCPSLTKIRRYVFYNCTSLEEVDTSNVTTFDWIGQFTNAGLVGKDLSFPKLATLASFATNDYNAGYFQGCGMKSFTAAICTLFGGNTKYTDRGGGCFQNCTNLQEVNAPLCTEFAIHCFDGCTSLVRVTCPSLTTLGHKAFFGCTALEYVDLAAVTSIGTGAFATSNLACDIDMPELLQLPSFQSSIYNIGYFYNTQITSFKALKCTTIASNNEDRSGGCFQSCSKLERVELRDVTLISHTSTFRGCNALTTFIIDNVTPPTISSNEFSGAPNAIFYVPDAAVTTYQNASNWSVYSSRIRGMSELPSE